MSPVADMIISNHQFLILMLHIQFLLFFWISFLFECQTILNGTNCWLLGCICTLSWTIATALLKRILIIILKLSINIFAKINYSYLSLLIYNSFDNLNIKGYLISPLATWLPWLIFGFLVAMATASKCLSSHFYQQMKSSGKYDL